MNITNWGHACVSLEADGTRLLVDPGNFTDVAAAMNGTAKDSEAKDGAVESGAAKTSPTALLVTHPHRDHCDTTPVVAALRYHPECVVWADATTCASLVEAGVEANRVHEAVPGATFTVGPFTVTVGGGKHAKIFRLIPVGINVTYLISADGKSVYHPGDSFDVPASTPDVVLTPVSGPWLKLGEAIEFVRTVGASTVIPTHDALNTRSANIMVDARLSDPDLAGQHTYCRLAKGESMTL